VLRDQRVVGDLVGRATRRAVTLLAVEAVGTGAVVAAIVAIAARLAALQRSPRIFAAIASGFAAAVVVGGFRRRGLTRAAIVSALERAQPAARNLIVTADELAAGSLAASAAARERVFADAAAVAAAVDLRAAMPRRRASIAAAAAVAAWTVVATQPLWQRAAARTARAVVPKPLVAAFESAPSLHVSVTIQPPAYTAMRETTVEDPSELRAIEGSVLAVTVDAASGRVTIEQDGALRPLARDAAGRFLERGIATRTGYFVISSDRGPQRTIPLIVLPDALPSVRLTAPGRDLVFSGGNPQIRFEAHATDDLGLRSLALRVTRVSGTGENFEFRDEDIPLQVSAATPFEWRGRASRSLSELGLREGEMLVYRAVAADRRPGDRTGSSDAFIIEVSKLGVPAGDAFTLPEEQSRYALSQQMLIIKTERLQQSRATVSAESLTAQALDLAVEQRMIRAEFVFMLGGEVEDEQAEAEQSSELQEGRLQNDGQRDLRSATVAMSRAEKALTAANTADALVAERAAVAALQRAFARDRYILRALASRSQLDASRRLTADLRNISDATRAQAPAPENRRAALVEDLVRGIARLARGGDAVDSRSLGSLLAAEAIRIDPASTRMRDIARALERFRPGETDAAAALSDAASRAVAELQAAQAESAGGQARSAPKLAGAFAALLREKR
jgi:hypothetical protein